MLVTSARVGIAVECFGRLGAEGDVPAAASFPQDRDELIVELHVVHRQAHQLAATDACVAE